MRTVWRGVAGSVLFFGMALMRLSGDVPVSRLAGDVLELARQPIPAHLSTTPTWTPGASETAEVARLEAMPAIQIPIEDASLASAIKIVAQSAGMNFIAPDAADFGESITMSATINPWRLLQLMAERYRFAMNYQNGMWFFSRESAGALIAKTYELQHANLDSVRAQETGASGFGGDAGDVSAGRQHGQGFKLVYKINSETVVDQVRELIGLPPLASQTMVAGDGKLPEPMGIRTTPTDDRKAAQEPKVIYLPNTNALYVVCYRSQHEHVAEYVRQVDQPPIQIRIEARFFATAHDPQSLLGIDYSEAQPRLSLSDGNAGGRIADQIDLQKVTERRWPPQAILSSSALSVQLNALESDSKTEKIDNPFVVTTSNHEALFSVGKEEPFLDSSTLSPGAVDGGLGSTTNRISVKRIGTAVNVVPTYFKGGPGERPRIRLVVKMELGRLEGYRQVTPEVTYPVVDSQKFEFTVTIEEGQALAFGGLTGLLNSKQEKRVPGLGKLPLIGGLFRHENEATQQRNMMAYIIPSIVRAEGDAPKVELRTAQDTR